MDGVKWIKLATDLFDNEKILLIEGDEKGETVLLVWVKLLCLAGKCHTDGVFRLGDTPYTPSMLARVIRVEEDTLTFALSQLERYDMIRVVNGAITVTNWATFQSLDAARVRKDKAALRKRRQREQQSQATVYETVIGHLNAVAPAVYDAYAPCVTACVDAWLDKGYTAEHLLSVIDKKAQEWRGTKWERYLRPETLFGQKFEQYLHEHTRPAATPSEYEQFMQQLKAQRKEEQNHGVTQYDHGADRGN